MKNATSAVRSVLFISSIKPACQTRDELGISQATPARISKLALPISRPVWRTGGLTPFNCSMREKYWVRWYWAVRNPESIGTLSIPVPANGSPVGSVKPPLKYRRTGPSVFSSANPNPTSTSPLPSARSSSPVGNLSANRAAMAGVQARSFQRRALLVRAMSPMPSAPGWP